MSAVRPLAPDDTVAVADLYCRILRKKGGVAPQGLRDYMRSFYLDGAFREADIPSLVHTDGSGRVSGFVGVHAVPFVVGGRKIRTAFCSALMVDDPAHDPMAGARLLKAFLDGPQDMSFSETSNPLSQSMWEKMRGGVLAAYSMEWFRVLRPSGFCLAFASQRLPLLRHLAPLARPLDAKLASRSGRNSLGVYVGAPAPAGLVTEETDRETFAGLVRQFSEDLAARPDWHGGYLEHVLETALDKPGFGEPVMAAVRTRSGEAIGGFLYHVEPGGIGRVLQVMAGPGRFATVLDRLLADALSRGAFGLRGRSSPELLQAAPGRSLGFATVSSTVIHARDPELAAPFLAGECFLTGLAGERWNRFFGNDFRQG